MRQLTMCSGHRSPRNLILGCRIGLLLFQHPHSPFHPLTVVAVHYGGDDTFESARLNARLHSPREVSPFVMSSTKLRTLFLRDISLCWAIYSFQIRRSAHVRLTLLTGRSGRSANGSSDSNFRRFSVLNSEDEGSSSTVKYLRLGISNRWNVTEADAPE